MNQTNRLFRLLKERHLFLVLVIALSYSCHDTGISLGNNVGLYQERPNDNYVEMCINKSSLGYCLTGFEVIPTNITHINKNDEVIISRTVSSNKAIKPKYWIFNYEFSREFSDCYKFNCDSLIKANRIGPLDSIAFLKELDNKGIDLELIELLEFNSLID